MARAPIYAAGGIVIRDGRRPRIAIVRRSKDDRWVLPRGKLKRGERPARGARREATEETGHRVRVREFLGAITYRAGGRPKVVQFWRMQAARHPSVDLMEDIAAVAWLPLPDAVKRLSYPLEKLFLRHAGRQALQQRKREAPRKRKKNKRRARHQSRPRRKPNAASGRRRAGPRRKRTR
jgi:8-oxo-dGTP diphosphatase